METISFNTPLVTGNEAEVFKELLSGNKFCGDGPYTTNCQNWLEKHHRTAKALLTTSCTHALELAALMIGIQPGDEVIMPSYTFVSSANAFVLRGAKIAFVDIDPATMNIDTDQVAKRINKNTKAILPVHYAGVSCDMDMIMDIANTHDLYVIEDAAQGILAQYKKRPLGSIGHLGALSFHETKNIHCGEGGALFINDDALIEKAEILREKGTNRKQFFRGEVDKYSWKEVGSSYLPSEFNAAFLNAQLKEAFDVINKRRQIWDWYYKLLEPISKKGLIELPHVPDYANHNGHLFFIKVQDVNQRNALITYLKENGIHAVFHYVPLHSSDAGKKYGTMKCDKYTTRESERLIRLPFHYDLMKSDLKKIVHVINQFFI